MLMKWQLSALALFPMIAMAQAKDVAPLRLCLPDIAIQPYISADEARPGLIEKLLFDSARKAGLRLSVERLPSARCRRALLDGSADVVPLVNAASNLEVAEFPMHGAQADARLRLLTLNVIIVRRKNDQRWSWDGERFIGDQPLVGVKRGMQVYPQRLARLGLSVDDAAIESDQLLRKLAASRVDVALLSEGEFALLQRKSPRPLQALPKPFAVVDYYLGRSRVQDEEHVRQIDAWREIIAKMRDMPAYSLPKPR